LKRINKFSKCLKVTDAMNSLGFTEQEQYSLYHLLAALISLGNITFSQDEQEKCTSLFFFFQKKKP